MYSLSNPIEAEHKESTNRCHKVFKENWSGNSGIPIDPEKNQDRRKNSSLRDIFITLTKNDTTGKPNQIYNPHVPSRALEIDTLLFLGDIRNKVKWINPWKWINQQHSWLLNYILL